MIRLLAALMLLAAPAFADATLGDVTVTQPMLRVTPPVAAGFVTIANAGSTGDLRDAAAVDVGMAGQVQPYGMKIDGNITRMSEVPGDLHLMLMGLAGLLEAGAILPVTATFADVRATGGTGVTPPDPIGHDIGGHDASAKGN